MSTDITIEAEPTMVLSFDDFTREHLPLIARSIQVLTNEPALADAALTAGTESVFRDWPQQRDVEQAKQSVFGEAVRHCSESTASDLEIEPDRITSVAISMAHHVFGWNAASIIEMSGVSADDVFQHVGDNQAGERLRDEVDRAEPARVDLAAMTSRPDHSKRRPIAMAIAAIAALLALGVLAQFVASPLRTKQVQDTSNIGVAPARPVFPGENMELEPQVPMAERLMQPSLVARGVTEGFVGVRTPTALDDTTIFVISPDGSTWEPAGSWELGTDSTVTQFEQVGNHYAIWFDSGTELGAPQKQLAVSEDLQAWTVFDLPADEPEPRGLRYQSAIADVAIRGDLVLAALRTRVEIDFAALLLSEGYTCGHSVTREAVTVNMCTWPLNVWTASEGEQLPAPNRLAISRNGEPLEYTSVPFGSETEPQLRLANDVFVLSDATGVGFATSTNAESWQAGAAQQPPFPVQLSVANGTGQVLGVGEAATGGAMLFFNDGPNTTTTRLDQIVSATTSDATVALASAPNRWALYVYEPDGRAWIAASDDGLNWNVAQAEPPVGRSVHLVASDDTALLQATDSADESSLTVIPLPGG